MKRRAKLSREGHTPILKQARDLARLEPTQMTKSAAGLDQARAKPTTGSILELLASLGSPATKTKRGLSIATLRKRYKADRLKAWKAKHG